MNAFTCYSCILYAHTYTYREVLQAPPTLLAVTHTHLLLFAATTLELVDSLDLRGRSSIVCVLLQVG